MDLNKVAAVLRPRRGMQSVDLGLLLGRRFWGRIILSWLILAAPLLVVVQLLTLWAFEYYWVMLLAGWWLKPLFDRITLYVISRGFFGSVPTVGESVRAVLRQWWSLEAVGDLTVRRFSPLRTVVLPVRVLEGLSGARHRARIRGLVDHAARGQGYGLLLFFLSFKFTLYISVFVGVVMLIPGQIGVGWEEVLAFLTEDATDWGASLVILGASLGVTLFVEPFFAAGGFGIYIQRRIEREGWDLELRFRQLAQRVQKSLVQGMVWLLVGVSIFVSEPAQVVAEEPARQIVGGMSLLEGGQKRGRTVRRELIPVDDPNQELAQILDAPPFGGEKIEERWQKKNQTEEQEIEDLVEALEWMGQYGPVILRALMWVLFVLIGAWALWHVMKFLARRSGRGAFDEARPRWQQELLEQSEGLGGVEGDVIAAARESWRAGDQRGALAILLWTSLMRFEEEERFHFARGWTASFCAYQVRDRGLKGELIAELARAFDRLAWAKRGIAPERFEALIAGWQRAFGGGEL